MESFDFLTEAVSFCGRHPIISLLWVITLGYFIYYQVLIWVDGVKLLGSREAVEMFNRDRAVFADVRPGEEYDRGHLAGAVSVPAEDLLSGKFSLVEKYRAKTVVVVGKSFDDTSAYKCARNLKKGGFACVLLNGGMQDWISKSYPVVRK